MTCSFDRIRRPKAQGSVWLRKRKSRLLQFKEKIASNTNLQLEFLELPENAVKELLSCCANEKPTQPTRKKQ
jgi:hypothetical protein